MTLNELVDTLQNIANNHGQLQSFQHGELSEVDLNKLNATQFPFLYALVPSVTIQRGQREYNVNLIVADRVQPDNSDRRDVHSDTLQILEDVINEFRHALSSQSNATHGFLDQTTSITCDMFTERFDNILSGWEAQISVLDPATNNLCLRP